MLVKLHDRLLRDCLDAYDEAHRNVPDDVVAAIRASGVSDWTIWREGTELFQLLVCEDWAVTSAELSRRTPSSWKNVMAALTDPTFGARPPVVVEAKWILRDGIVRSDQPHDAIS